MKDRIFHIGELSKITGINKSAINHYDKIGLLNDPVRDEYNYRLYTQDDLIRLFFIKSAKKCDFSLGEIKLILSNRDTGEDTCTQISEHLKRRRLSLEHRIEQLNEDVSKLKNLENQIDKQTSRNHNDCVCPVIETKYK